MFHPIYDQRRDRAREDLVSRGWFTNPLASTFDATSPSGRVTLDVSHSDKTCYVDTWGVFDRQSRQSFPPGIDYTVVVAAALAAEAEIEASLDTVSDRTA